MSTALIAVSRMDLPTFALTKAGQDAIDLALQSSALIGKVTTADDNTLAVRAQVELKSVLSTFEKARKAVKEPFLQAGRELDYKVAEAQKPVQQEWDRISRLVSEFQEKERVAKLEQERRQRAEIERIEAEKQAELRRLEVLEATGKVSAEQAAQSARAIEELAQVRTAQHSQPVETARAEGQRVIKEIQITKITKTKGST